MLERRILQNGGAELRLSAVGAKQVIAGYAAVFYQSGDKGTEYQLSDGLVERIDRHAFDRAIRENHDVRALFNHDPNNLLGRTANETCRLTADERGLNYTITVNDDDPDHARVIEKIRRGDLTGSSFAFRPVSVRWEELPDGSAARIVEDLNLYDVGPVTYPAYEASTTGLRSDDQIAAIRREYEIWRTAEFEWRKRWQALCEAELKAEQDLKDTEQDEMEMRRRKLALLAL